VRRLVIGVPELDVGHEAPIREGGNSSDLEVIGLEVLVPGNIWMVIPCGSAGISTNAFP
jgi:hypothetical protein